MQATFGIKAFVIDILVLILFEFLVFLSHKTSMDWLEMTVITIAFFITYAFFLLNTIKIEEDKITLRYISNPFKKSKEIPIGSINKIIIFRNTGIKFTSTIIKIEHSGIVDVIRMDTSKREINKMIFTLNELGIDILFFGQK